MAVDNEEAFVYKVYSTLLLLSFVFIASGQLNGSVTNTGSVSGMFNSTNCYIVMLFSKLVR